MRTPVPAGSEHVQFDQRVFVPKPTADSIVVASFSDFAQPVIDSVGQLFFKRPIQYIATNLTISRFVPGSASNPHVMTVPSCLGWSPVILDPTPYQWIGVGHMPQLQTGGPRARLRLHGQVRADSFPLLRLSRPGRLAGRSGDRW